MSLTIKQWDADPTLRQSLAAILADPVLSAAIDIIRDKELLTVTHTGGDLVQYFALMGAKRVGYLEALKNLRELAEVQTLRGLPEKKAWQEEAINPSDIKP